MGYWRCNCIIIPFFKKNKLNDNFIMINGDDLYGSKSFIDGYQLLNKVDKDISIVGGLKLIDTLPKKGKVNEGILYIDNKNVIGMEEIIRY